MSVVVHLTNGQKLHSNRFFVDSIHNWIPTEHACIEGVPVKMSVYKFSLLLLSLLEWRTDLSQLSTLSSPRREQTQWVCFSVNTITCLFNIGNFLWYYTKYPENLAG